MKTATTDAPAKRIDALKLILNVLVLVGIFLGVRNYAGSTYGIAEGFGLAVGCAVARAILDRLDAIHDAIKGQSLRNELAETVGGVRQAEAERN